MAILSAKCLPDDFLQHCCNCDEEITKQSIKAGNYAHIVTIQPIRLRCELCQEDHEEQQCACDD
jgi:hypothetical protein